ncbi:hypothetical protein [Clostridium butyricum]
MFYKLKKNNSRLTNGEINFIVNFASGFIGSYTINGEINVDNENDPNIMDEINICKNLINKFGRKN